MKLAPVLLFVLGTGSVLADTLWTRAYGSPYDGDDAVCTVLTDAYNNVYVVGTGGYVPGIGGSNMVVVKYLGQDGRPRWTKRIAAEYRSADVAMAAAVRPDGAVCVTGQTGKFPNHDILTVQIDPNANEVWRATCDGAKHAPDLGTAVATDTQWNVFVAGCVQNHDKDFVTMKYYWDGTRAWAETYDGGGDDRPTAIALGPDGSVYVTGSNGGSNPNFLIVKYSPSGVEQWAVEYDGTDHLPDWAAAMVVDDSGSVFVTGCTDTGKPPTTHIATVKYDSAGTQKWVALYEQWNSRGAALALGASVLYVAGWTTAAAGDADYVTIAYDCATGDTLWTRRDSGAPGSEDAAVGIAVGPDSSIWVTGSSEHGFMTVLYTSDGGEHWVERYNRSTDDVAVAIAVDNENRVVVAGNTRADTGYDFLTVKFDTIGYAVAEPRDQRPLSDFRFEVVPNPSTSGHAILRYSPIGPGAANVTVSGVDGRVAVNRSLETGGTCPLDLGKLEAGVYIVRLESGGRAATQKLVIGQ